MRPSRLVLLLIIFGLYLTLRGYHSRDGDQAHRLPLLLHKQDATLYAKDPFVKAFDAFNPHAGSIALVDFASRPFGLSAGIFALFTLTFCAGCLGASQMAESIWPSKSNVGWVAVGLILTAKAGNIGTNHLFEAMLLDRLMALSLAWIALAGMIADPNLASLRSAPWIGVAALIHPSLGLQLACVVGGSWLVWAICGQVGRKSAFLGLASLAVCLVPALAIMSGASGALMEGLDPDEFRRLSVDLQSPQHMMPHIWRAPQWYAWFAYLGLVGVALRGYRQESEPQNVKDVPISRLIVMIVVTLFGLLLAYVAIEYLEDLRVTLFQPFRLATLVRGLALVVISGHVLKLWNTGELIPRCRAAMLAVGLFGDRAMAVATCVELVFTFVDPRLGIATFVGGMAFLARHDTESGHWPILASMTLVILIHLYVQRHELAWTPRRIRVALVSAWFLPGLAFLAPILPPKLGETLTFRWRFRATPVDDIEKLAVWCRDQTPVDAGFIAPPGPKTFRLWSQRSLAFNRAGSPYHAAGLADWAGRYRDHVGFVGSTSDFVQAYQNDRHGFESRYDVMTDNELASLAKRQGAEYVVASSKRADSGNSQLTRLHTVGKYAVYRVVDPTLAKNQSSDFSRK